jgi:tetratricopeptide (TPR) repeat protein
MGFGIGAWGIGSLLNNWGYSSFINPYFMPHTTVVQPSTVVVQPTTVYDYSRPIDTVSQPPAQTVVDQSVATLDSARDAFRSGDYAQALQLAEQAIQGTPNDPALHEFRALCLFALGRYDDAAVPMYTALSAGPGWDWTTLAGLYPAIDVYTQQLRALEAYCRATPQAASARFLLSALYMTQGNNDAAAGMLQQVVALQPRDTLSAQLLTALTAKPETGATPAQPPSAPAAAVVTADQPPANPPSSQAPTEANPPAGPSLPTGPVPANLVGTWTAHPAKDVTITLTFDDQKTFGWKLNDRGQPREFRGEATFEKETLALAPPDQPPMVGTLTWKDDSHFQFKALGAPSNDPGLNFGK